MFTLSISAVNFNSFTHQFNYLKLHNPRCLWYRAVSINKTELYVFGEYVYSHIILSSEINMIEISKLDRCLYFLFVVKKCWYPLFWSASPPLHISAHSDTQHERTRQRVKMALPTFPAFVTRFSTFVARK